MKSPVESWPKISRILQESQKSYLYFIAFGYRKQIRAQLITDKILKMRELRSFSQEYMANQLDITQAGYSKYESGTTDITFSKIQEIASILSVTPTDLVASDGQKYFNSFDNIEVSNNGSVIIDMKTDEHKKSMKIK